MLLKKVPKKLYSLWNKFEYFPHQIDGIRWMLEKEILGTTVIDKKTGEQLLIRGGLQCDDMGLGKTIQIISTMINHPQPKTLLLAPLAMVEMWIKTCQNAGLIVYEARTDVDGMWIKRKSQNKFMSIHLLKVNPAVYITNYEKIYHRFKEFNYQWDRIVLDEAHKIRNGDSSIAFRLRKLVAPIHWAITGTPLVNSFKDVTSLLAFLGAPYSYNFAWTEVHEALIPDILIHRSLEEVRSIIAGAPPLPEIHNLTLPFTTEEEEDFYHGIQGGSDVVKYKADMEGSSSAITRLLRLRQISVHPQVYINAMRRKDTGYRLKTWTGPSTKTAKIGEIILADEGVHKYIVFCQFYDEMMILRDYLRSEGIIAFKNILLYNGSMNAEERNRVLIKSKQTTEKTVLLLQLQAGGVGLNLQEYDRIIFVSPYWTSALMDQAIARAVRMGQTQVVQVYHLRLEAENDKTINIDTAITAKADMKRDMLNDLFEMTYKPTAVEIAQEFVSGIIYEAINPLI